MRLLKQKCLEPRPPGMLREIALKAQVDRLRGCREPLRNRACGQHMRRSGPRPRGTTCGHCVRHGPERNSRSRSHSDHAVNGALGGHGNKEAQKRLGGASDERLDPKWLRT